MIYYRTLLWIYASLDFLDLALCHYSHTRDNYHNKSHSLRQRGISPFSSASLPPEKKQQRRLGSPARVKLNFRRASSQEPPKSKKEFHPSKKLQRSQSEDLSLKHREVVAQMRHANGADLFWSPGSQIYGENAKIASSNQRVMLGAYSEVDNGVVIGKCRGDQVTCEMSLEDGAVGSIEYQKGSERGGLQRYGYGFAENYGRTITTDMVGRPVIMKAHLKGRGQLSMYATSETLYDLDQATR